MITFSLEQEKRLARPEKTLIIEMNMKDINFKCYIISQKTIKKIIIEC